MAANWPGSNPTLLVEDFSAKVLLIGDASVGKTALARRYTRGRFDEETEPSIGVDFESRIQVVGDDPGVKVKLMLWDTAGQERFRSISSSYLRGAHGVVSGCRPLATISLVTQLMQPHTGAES